MSSALKNSITKSDGPLAQSAERSADDTLMSRLRVRASRG